MSKILIVADIHIGPYTLRNPVPDYRLHQGSRIVPENIIKVGKANGCDYIAFAGDVIEKSILRPYVIAEVKRFLERVMSEFKGGWIIYGNHCMDNRSSDQTINDSLLGVILPSNLKYAHQTIEVVDGISLGFSNFQPVFDLSWIPSKVDALITHATICYNPNTEFIKSQELDESKFDIAFCGDIHKKGVLGKYVSVGIPQKCKMGDSDECSGIVLDCATKRWDYVDLNPDDNLMKFKYTSVSTQHGWNPELNTWFEYKPILLNNDNGVIKVETAADKVEELFNQYIMTNSLMPVHDEVLKNIRDLDAGSIDFDFTLTKFSCKNWRSIDELTMYFNYGDKILIIGDNGSGKSSLTSALMYAFTDTRDSAGISSLKSFVQFGTKDCMTEVEFLYQKNNYRLRRGTKEYGLWINDELQKYSDKRAFENDIRARFPFIEYIRVFFLDADHNQLLGNMKPEEKSLIVSKFFKLDKIDTLHDKAVSMLKQLGDEAAQWRAKISSHEEVLRYINSKLSEIELPSISKADLEQSRWEGLEIQRKSNEWNTFVNQSSSLSGARTAVIERLGALAKEVTQFRALETIDAEILAAQQEISSLQSQVANLGSVKTRLDFKIREIEALKVEGNNAYRESLEIGIGKVCSSCGQVIQTTDALMEHKRELEAKVEDLKRKKVILDSELGALQEEWARSSQTYSSLSSEIGKINQRISVLMSEKNNQERILRDIDSEKTKLRNIDLELQKLVKPEEVYLPDNFMEKMALLDSQINAWTSYETNNSDLIAHQAELDICNQAIFNLQTKAAEFQKYVTITGPTGEIYNVILSRLATQFSDNNVNYYVKKFTNRGEHLNLESQFNNNGNFVDYGACSSGQKTILDVHFLQKIVTRLGLLVMDEFLKHLDPGNHDVCIDMISEMNIGCIMLSSHMESVATFNNKTCKISLNKDGMSEVEYT